MTNEDLRVLKANSRRVDVRDGDRLLKGVWTIEPAVALNVYHAQRGANGRTITFITDIDSLSFDVQPLRTYDFIILLDGVDSCRTRISTMAQSYRRGGPSSPAGPPTIPITYRRGKIHLQAKVNDSQTLDLIFDTGADTHVLYPSAMDKAATLAFDGTTNNVGTGGATLRQTSSDNRLEVAGLRWDHESVLYVEKQADAADGIVGYRAFEDKVVEIDYDRMVMVIHDALPAHALEFDKTAMPFAGSLRAVEAVLFTGERGASGLFMLDTGSDGTLMVNQAFVIANGLRGTMRKVGASTSRGVGSGAIRNEMVLLPELTIAGFKMSNVPIHLALPTDGNEAPPGGVLSIEVLKGVLSIEVLKRFNTILDYPRNEAYFKPNTLFDSAFTQTSSGPTRAVIVGVAVVSLALLAGLAFLGAKRRSRAVPHVSK